MKILKILLCISFFTGFLPEQSRVFAQKNDSFTLNEKLQFIDVYKAKGDSTVEEIIIYRRYYSDGSFSDSSSEFFADISDHKLWLRVHKRSWLIKYNDFWYKFYKSGRGITTTIASGDEAIITRFRKERVKDKVYYKFYILDVCIERYGHEYIYWFNPKEGLVAIQDSFNSNFYVKRGVDLYAD